MQPYANFGIRFRTRYKVGMSGGKHIKKGTPMTPMLANIMGVLSSVGMAVNRVPFWERMYRQGRRG